MAKPQITALMQKEMTRKEFLAAMGLAVGSVMGFSSIIHMLTGKSLGATLQHGQSAGYGSSAYGGSHNSN